MVEFTNVRCCTAEDTLQADASWPQDDRVAPTVIKMLALPARGRKCRASDVHLLHLAAKDLLVWWKYREPI